MGDVELTYRELAGAAAAVADAVVGVARAAVWAEPTMVVPLNPGYGSRELEHIVADAEPQLLFAPGELLASYKRPREIHFVDRLPRNAMGKVTKKDLDP